MAHKVSHEISFPEQGLYAMTYHVKRIRQKRQRPNSQTDRQFQEEEHDIDRQHHLDARRL